MASPTRKFPSLAFGGAGTVGTGAETNSIDVTVDLGFGEGVVVGGGGGGGVLFVDVADVVCLEVVVEYATVMDSLDVVARGLTVESALVVEATEIIALEVVVERLVVDVKSVVA